MKTQFFSFFSVIFLICSFLSCSQPKTDTDTDTDADADAITYTVIFDSCGGSTIESIPVEDGDKVIEPTQPSRTGYKFRGWYTEPACLTVWSFAENTVAGDITLYAKWITNAVAFAGSWTGFMRIDSYSPPMYFPVEAIGQENGLYEETTYYANDEFPGSMTVAVTDSGISYSFSGNFGEGYSGTQTASGTWSDNDNRLEFNFLTHYETGGLPDETGIIRLSRASTDITGTWMGTYRGYEGTNPVDQGDATVIFKADGTFTASGEENGLSFSGTWTIDANGTFSATSSGRLSDTIFSHTGTYGARRNGNVLTDGTYHVVENGLNEYNGKWSFCKLIP